MKQIVKHKAFLRRAFVDPSIVKKASLSEISFLVNLLFNLGCVPFTASEKKQVSKYLKEIRAISGCSRERKARALLTQHGGAILPAVIPAVLALAGLLL